MCTRDRGTCAHVVALCRVDTRIQSEVTIRGYKRNVVFIYQTLFIYPKVKQLNMFINGEDRTLFFVLPFYLD